MRTEPHHDIKATAIRVALIMEGGAGPQNSFGCMMFPS